MTYIYRLAGENLELAEAELNGFLDAVKQDEEVKREGRLAFTESHPGQLRRLALVHEVVELIDETEELEISYRPEQSFAVRAVNLGTDQDRKQVERELGEILSTEQNSVDLENPDETLKVYIKEDRYYIGRLVESIDRSLFNRRKNQKRPFSSPISLDPVLARVLVNLSGVSAGEKLLDPFCGTGGILIEAGLCGIDVYGADLQQEMVEGTRENLEEFGILNHTVEQASIKNIRENFETGFEAVVTDLPYGKASKTEGDPVEDFLEVFSELGKKAVFMSDKPELNDYVHKFEVYVHKNLTRYIYIEEQ